MTDRELLELAAKAAGIKILRFGESEDYYEPCRGYVAFIEWLWPGDEPTGTPMEAEWNPLDDDGDALRLAVDLDIGVQHLSEPGPDFGAEAWRRHDRHFAKRVVDSNNFRSATRRAIVRVAAEIGRAM